MEAQEVYCWISRDYARLSRFVPTPLETEEDIDSNNKTGFLEKQRRGNSCCTFKNFIDLDLRLPLLTANLEERKRPFWPRCQRAG